MDKLSCAFFHQKDNFCLHNFLKYLYRCIDVYIYMKCISAVAKCHFIFDEKKKLENTTTVSPKSPKRQQIYQSVLTIAQFIINLSKVYGFANPRVLKIRNRTNDIHILYWRSPQIEIFYRIAMHHWMMISQMMRSCCAHLWAIIMALYV